MTSQPIIKLLTAAGAGSRRKMAEAIKQGRVSVNGNPVESFLHPVNTETDVVMFNGRPIQIHSKPSLIYLMMNKPKGVTSTTRDFKGSKNVLDIIPQKYKTARLYPVGRLDKETTGLILLTNDGDLTNRLTHPRFEQEKEYLVKIEGKLKPEEQRQLEKGIKLDDGITGKSRLHAVNIPPFNYAIVIHEGRKRQIRRMFAALGYMVLELKRIRMSSLRLGSLPEGQICELTPEELKTLSK